MYARPNARRKEQGKFDWVSISFRKLSFRCMRNLIDIVSTKIRSGADNVNERKQKTQRSESNKAQHSEP